METNEHENFIAEHADYALLDAFVDHQRRAAMEVYYKQGENNLKFVVTHIANGERYHYSCTVDKIMKEQLVDVNPVSE